MSEAEKGEHTQEGNGQSAPRNPVSPAETLAPLRNREADAYISGKIREERAREAVLLALNALRDVDKKLGTDGAVAAIDAAVSRLREAREEVLVLPAADTDIVIALLNKAREDVAAGKPLGELDQVFNILDDVRRGTAAAAGGEAAKKSKRRKFSEIIESVKNAPAPQVTSTGVKELDEKLGQGHPLAGAGWVAGRLYMIAAYVGSYKTRGLLTYALAAVAAGVRVIFVSAEMIGEELALITGENFKPKADMEILDQTYDLTTVTEEIHDFLAEGDGKPSIVFLDYAQILSNQAEVRNREREVASITRSLSKLARREKVAIVATAQLNRASQQSEDGPNLRHLRESGGLEADADTVLITVYERPKLSITCKKHRWGAVDWELHLAVDGDTMTFDAYSMSEVVDDRLDRIQEAVEKRVLAAGPSTPRELYDSIRVNGKKAKAYEIDIVANRSKVVMKAQDGRIVRRNPEGTP